MFRNYEHLKLYIILCIFCILIIFYIYQTIYCFPNKFKCFPSKFFLWCIFSSLICKCSVKLTLHMVFWSLKKSVAVIKFMKEILLTKEEMIFLMFLTFYHFSISDRAWNRSYNEIKADGFLVFLGFIYTCRIVLLHYQFYIMLIRY